MQVVHETNTAVYNRLIFLALQLLKTYELSVVGVRHTEQHSFSIVFGQAGVLPAGSAMGGWCL